MAKRDFSGDDVIKVLVNAGNFWVDRVSGDHYILKYEHPSSNDNRTVVIPRHNTLSISTLRSIADDAEQMTSTSSASGSTATDSPVSPPQGQAFTV